uniref:Uncharacterized protein n=1 Tax=Plectus sambesii TaxID=2011161 RepID=A0A914WL85_9BILA
MVSAGISWNSKTQLHFIPKNERLNAQGNQELLADGLLPDCELLYPDGNFIFQQGGARPHTAVGTIAVLNERAPAVIGPREWPAFSPNLNPCDYRLWAYGEREVYKNGNIATADELHQRIEVASICLHRFLVCA